MLGHDWRLIRNRDAYALGLGVLLTMFTYSGSDYTPPALAPCSNAGWQNEASFFIALCLGVALVEGVNWVGGLITRDMARSANFEVPRSESEISGSDLLIPAGWTGLTLGLVLLIMPYIMFDPNQCEPLRFGRLSVRYVVGALAVAYGLLLMGQVFQSINSKGFSPKPK
jgi:hypothetical protein